MEVCGGEHGGVQNTRGIRRQRVARARQVARVDTPRVHVPRTVPVYNVTTLYLYPSLPNRKLHDKVKREKVNVSNWMYNQGISRCTILQLFEQDIHNEIMRNNQ